MSHGWQRVGALSGVPRLVRERGVDPAQLAADAGIALAALLVAEIASYAAAHVVERPRFFRRVLFRLLAATGVLMAWVMVAVTGDNTTIIRPAGSTHRPASSTFNPCPYPVASGICSNCVVETRLTNIDRKP